MTEDFTTRLRLQLREAAEREERRGALHRAALATRASATVPRVATVVGAVIAAIVVGFAASAVITVRPEPATNPPARVAARFSPAPALGLIAGGEEGVWVLHEGTTDMLRLDPRTRRVTARVRVPDASAHDLRAVAADATGAYIATYASRLVHIDARTHRVTSTHLKGIGGHLQGVQLQHGVAWAAGPDGVMAIEQATGRPLGVVRTGRHDVELLSLAIDGDDGWALLGDSTLMRFDTRSFAVRSRLRPLPNAIPFHRLMVVRHAVLILHGDGFARRLDPATGRTVWRVQLGRSVSAAVAARGLLWVAVAAQGGQRLVAIDPITGQRARSLPLGEFSVVSGTAVGCDIWLSTSNGHIVVVHPQELG